MGRFGIINLLIQYQPIDNPATRPLRMPSHISKFPKLIVLCLAAAAVGQVAEAAKQLPFTETLQAVTATLPSRQPLTRRLLATGSVFAWQEVTIAPEVGGYQLASVSVEIGDHVVRGQELARLNSELLKSQADIARASVMQAQAMLDNTRAGRARGESLFKQGVLSQADLDTLRANTISAEASLATAQANLDSADLRVRLTTVRAPDEGVISARSANVGQVVQAGTEMLRLLRQGRLEWRAEVPEADMRSIRTGMKVSVQTVDGGLLEGRVRSVAPTIQSNSRTGLIYVDIPATGGARPGMFARGVIEVGTSQALTVPLSCLQVEDGYNYLYVLKPGGSVQRRRVQIGVTQENRVEITEGLAGDERVVSSGVAFLSDGQRVNVRPAT
jgi:RND family efflux transporter MFP subunit